MDWLIDIDAIEDPTARAVLAALRPVFEQLQRSNDELKALVEARDKELAKRERELDQRNQEIAELRRLFFGQKSERTRTPRMPSTAKEIKDQKKSKLTDEERARKRREAAERRRRKREERLAALPLVERQIKVKAEQLVCSHCAGNHFAPLGPGEVSERIEFVPAHLVRERIVRQKMACRCGHCIVVADNPPTVTDGALYGPGLHAHVVVSKCADSLPLNRQATILRRSGIDVSRNSLGDLFHRCAELLKPLYQRVLELIAASEYVNADETTLRMQKQKKCKTCYMWTFIAGGLVAFVFSSSRSGETPKRVLEGTTGKLQVDGYSGYNVVCVPEGRERVGCMAHSRRKFFEARSSAESEANEALALILKLYEVEYQAVEQDIVGTSKHLALRKLESTPVMAELKAAMKRWKGEHTPKSPLGKAIKYMMSNWKELTVFLKDPQVPLDNNISERALRSLATGRKNFLFVGNKEAGENLAILQTLVMSCIENDVNAYEYLKDVLIRIQSHPIKRIDELLPHRWRPPDEENEDEVAQIN